MTALPSKVALADSQTTESQFQSAIGALRDIILELPGGGPVQSSTIVSDVCVPSAAVFMSIDTEGGAVSDNLANLTPTNVRDGYLLALSCVSSARSVRVKHAAAGSGQIKLNAQTDITLDNPNKVLWLRYRSATDDWTEIQKSWIDYEFDFAIDTGVVNAYAIAPSLPITAYKVGQRFAFIAANANTDASTLSVSGLPAKAIVRPDGSVLKTNDITNGISEVRYNGSVFILLTAKPDAPVVDTGWSTGDSKLTLKTVADPGWVMFNDGSIGDAISGATTRANADTEALFTLIWNNFSNTNAPLQDSSGNAVARGTSAAADYAAHRRLVTPKMLGRAIALSGAGSGLTARLLGDALGEETHALTSAENGPHSHGATGLTASSSFSGINDGEVKVVELSFGQGGTLAQADQFTSGFQFQTVTPRGNVTTTIGGITQSSGNASPHNNMQPTTFAFNVMVKL